MFHGSHSFFHFFKRHHHRMGWHGGPFEGRHGCADGGPRGHHQPGRDEGGGFGVRRPLRFLAHKLDLNEAQVKELAKILSELKTERAQAEVDQQRTLTAFADAISTEAFDTARATQGLDLRIESAQRLRRAVEAALTAVHALLSAEQRQRFAHLLRTGILSM
jgi:Spy/CpxP family protein refolding chaperone